MKRYAAIILLVACSGPEPNLPPAPGITTEEVRAARAAWPPGLATTIDSASLAYGAQQFDRAADLYRRAATIAPEISAGWYGVYIAEHARGNVAAADSALERAIRLPAPATATDSAAADSAL